MDNTIIIILGIILLVLIILNHVTIVKTSTTIQANCSQTAFGCCPDGVNSKVNFYGTNCPGYRPEPGYPITPTPVRPLPGPIPIGPGHPTPLTPPGPGPSRQKPIGGCAGTVYGCCPNNQTPKIDIYGSNCNLK